MLVPRRGERSWLGGGCRASRVRRDGNNRLGRTRARTVRRPEIDRLDSISPIGTCGEDDESAITETGRKTSG